MNGHLEGEQPYLGELLTMVINHFLNGMILQVGGGVKSFPPLFELESQQEIVIESLEFCFSAILAWNCVFPPQVLENHTLTATFWKKPNKCFPQFGRPTPLKNNTLLSPLGCPVGGYDQRLGSVGYNPNKNPIDK